MMHSVTVPTYWYRQIGRCAAILLLLLGLGRPAWAVTGPEVKPDSGGPIHSLTEALNSDGTLKTGLAGSFTAAGYRMEMGRAGKPVFRPAGATGAGDEGWQDGFNLSGTNGYVNSIVASGTDIYIAGAFTAVVGVPAKRVAKWNGTTWSALGAGLDGEAMALAVSGTDVYVVTAATQAASYYVAKWNGQTWSALSGVLSGGYYGGIRALAVASNGYVYVGGYFTQAGSAATNHLAMWNGTAWSAVGSGLDGGYYDSVGALAVSGTDLYVAGSFTRAGGVVANNIAKWDGSTWSALGSGTPSDGVNGLAVASTGEVYAGGSFTAAGGVAATNIAKWNGSTWSALGAGMSDQVGQLSVAGNGELYVGTIIVQSGTVTGGRVAKWNGTAWSLLGSQTNANFGGLAVLGTEVYIGGAFTQASGANANYLAKWDGTAWGALGIGLNERITVLAVAGNGDVYAGGWFTAASGLAITHIAKWNGTVWSPLGAGVNGDVYELAVAPTGELYVGGRFTQADGVAASNIAKWDGAAWSSLGVGRPGAVSALAIAGNGDVYANGNSNTMFPPYYDGVAKWNGTTWSTIGAPTNSNSNINGYINAIAVSGSDIYAGGGFNLYNQAGTAFLGSNLAKWNGTTWSALGTGVNGIVNALAVTATGELYVGGDFRTAGGMPASRIAKWNGTAWSSLSYSGYEGTNGIVNTLAMRGSDLYVGGEFTAATVMPTAHVAKWNGQAWLALGTGLNKTVNSLGFLSNGDIVAGGAFDQVGDGSKVSAFFAIYRSRLVTRVGGAAASVAPLSLYPNPARSSATLNVPAAGQVRLVRMVDALGREVQRQQLPAHATALLLDLRGLPAGVYHVQCGKATARLLVE